MMKSLRGRRRKAPGERKTPPEREVSERIARLRRHRTTPAPMRPGRTPPAILRRRLAVLGVVAAALALLVVALAGKGAASRRPLGHGRDRPRSNPDAVGRAAALDGGGRPGGGRAKAPGGTATVSEWEESPAIRALIALGKPIYCAGPRGDEVALTFDDGPGQYTRLALAKLLKHRVKATFFIVGRNISLMPDALPAERGLGAVGDHTYTHPLLTSLSRAEAEAEIVKTKRAVEAASGGPVFLFRPPYGGRDAAIDAIAKANGLLEIMWTVDSADSLGASYAQIESNVISGLRPGAIILMHENHGQTIRAMLSIFAALQRRHLKAVSVARLLTDDPPSRAQVLAGGTGCGVRATAGSSGG
jgi:peptidoglycan/xylan/chitin deacetylase (PgdA/CDA1 family)